MVAVLTSGGAAVISAGAVRRAHDEAAPNAPDFGDISAEYVDGNWYVRVSRIPTTPDLIDQGRLVVWRVVSGVPQTPYKTPIVTLAANEFVLCGPGAVTSDTGTIVVGLEAVLDGVPGRPVRVRDLSLGLEPPTEETPADVAWTLATGDEPGELVVTVTSITNGSGLNGVPIYIRFSLNGAPFENLGDGTLAVESTSIITTPSTPCTVVLQWSNDTQTWPQSAPKSATSGAEDEPVTTLPVWNLPQPQSFTEGNGFTVDWTDYCTGADSFQVVTGLTGGVSSGDDDELYDVASLVVETVDLTIEATNAQGTSVGVWTITVEPAVLAPSVVNPVANQSLVNGDTLLIHLDGPNGVFSGTEPVTFTVSPPSDADFVLDSTAHTFGNPNPLVSPRTSFPVTLTATNSAGSVNTSFNISVSIVRAAAPVWNTDVTMDAAQTIYTGWRSGVVSWPGVTGTPLWTRSTPDANDSVPAGEYEEFESLGSNLYRMRMTDPLKRGNPDTQTATVSLGSNPIATTNGSNNIVITKTAHGMGVGRRVTIANAPDVNGITAANINGSRQLIAVTTDTFTVQAGANATSTGSGGSTGITYAANRADFSVMAPGDNANIRVAFHDGAVVSHWSLPMAVPQVVSIGDRYWRFNSRRPQAAYEATPPWVGSIGNQYQHVVSFNKRSLRDPSKKYFMFTGQDENGLSFSPDGGRTISPLVGFGMWGSSINGIYYCSDDLDTGLLLALGGHGSTTGRCGLYASVDEGRICKRIKLTRTGGADAFASNRTYFPRANHNLIDRRPQNASGTLTDSQRPIYVVAQQKDGSANFTGCYLFKWDGGDIFNASDWEQVYEWPVADIRGASSTIGEEQGMMFVRVAPNGDVIVAGRRGVWVSTNGGTAFTKVDSRSVRGIAVDMTTTGVSGAVIGISDKAGANDSAVLKTANIRTTAFTAPTNTNLPANAIVQSLNGPEGNFNRLYVVYKTGSSYSAKLSTNGASSWQPVNVVAPPGYNDSANKWRYTWGGGRGPGIYPHPSDFNHVFAMVFISGAVSVDGGATFRGDANAYFDHAHTKGWGYDRNDFRKLYAMLQDSGSFYQNEMKWYEELGLKYNATCVNQAGTSGTPFGFATTVGGSSGPSRTQGRGAVSLHGTTLTLFTLSADNVNERCIPCIIKSNGDIVARTDVGYSRCAKFFHHPTDATKIILGKWFITPASTPETVGFLDYSDREVLGYAMVGGSPVWYFGQSGPSGTQIYRAPNANGSGGALWKTLSSGAQHTAVAVDFHNDKTIFAARSNQAGKIERVTDSATTVIFDAAAACNSALTAQGVSTTDRPAVVVDYLVTDPNMPGLLYAALDVPGLPIIFMTQNANDASPTWTNETRNLPHTYHWFPTLHPVTGEIFINSSMGEFVLPAPSGYPALPNLNYFTGWMDTFYGRADVPDPPILPGVT